MMISAARSRHPTPLQRGDAFRRSQRRRGARRQRRDRVRRRARSHTPSCSSASTASATRCAAARRAAAKSASCCCCSTGRRSPTRSSARSRSARCRSRSTRCSSRPTTATCSHDSGAVVARRQRRAAAADQTHSAIRDSGACATSSSSAAAPERRRDVVRRAARRRLAGPRGRNRPAATTAGLLALLVRQHRRAEGLRAPAPRHGRVRGAVRQRSARHQREPTGASASPSCSSPTASATPSTFRSPSARPRSCGRARRRPANVYDVIERHRPTLFFSVPTGYGMLLAHDREPTSICRQHPARRLGRRGAAAGAVRALQAALRHRHPRRHRLDRSAAHVHLESSGRDRVRIERPDRSRIRGRAFSTTMASPCRWARSAISGSAATRSAPATGTSTRRRSETIQGEWLRTGDKYTAGRGRLLLVRRPIRRHAEGRRQWVSPVEVENVAPRARRGAGMRRGRLRGSRRAGQADGVRRASPGIEASPERAAELEQFVRAAVSRSTSVRAGWRSSPSCRRPRPARSSVSSFVNWQAGR